MEDVSVGETTKEHPILVLQTENKAVSQKKMKRGRFYETNEKNTDAVDVNGM